MVSGDHNLADFDLFVGTGIHKRGFAWAGEVWHRLLYLARFGRRFTGEVANGTVEVNGDGHGKWTTGNLRVEVANGDGGSSSKHVCSCDLTKGHYSVKPDGTAVSITSWKPAANDSQCSSFRPELFTGGHAGKRAQNAEASAASVKVLLTGPNTGYQMAVGSAGFATRRCEGATSN